MVEFENFLDTALQMGKRDVSIGRMIPVFLPEGNHQNELYTRSINYLKDVGFTVMDIRNDGYENSINFFKLKWRELSGKYPSANDFTSLNEEPHKLLIACGNEDHHQFWKFLAKDSVLYAGGAFPPISQLSSRCILIPDSACSCNYKRC